MVYWIYLYLKLIIVNANSVYLPESYATVVNWGYLVLSSRVNLLSKILRLFGFTLFDYGRT